MIVRAGALADDDFDALAGELLGLIIRIRNVVSLIKTVIVV